MKSQLKQHIGYWINRMRMCIHLSFEQRLSRYDITVAQWCVLQVLSSLHHSTIGELATYIEVDKASISRIVNRLVERELVSHLEGKDRRTGSIELTKGGKKLVPKLLKEAEENEKFFFSDLSPVEKAQLQILIRKILSKTPSIIFDGWLNEEIICRKKKS